MNCPACGSVLADTASTCGSCQADARLTVLGKGGETYGPYTASQLAQYVRAGKIPAGAALEDSQGNRTTPTQLGLAEGAPAAPAAPAPPAAPVAPTPPVGPARTGPLAHSAAAGPVTPPAGAAPVGPAPRPTATAPAKKNTGKTCAIVGGVGCGCLIIIGIIALAVLLPVFKVAREKARDTICMGQAMTLWEAMMNYADANNDTLPDAATWQQDIQPFLQSSGGAMECPKSGLGAQSYGFNPALGGVSMSSITSPATTPLVFDAAFADGSPGPHNAAWVVCFADGHVELVQPTGAAP